MGNTNSLNESQTTPLKSWAIAGYISMNRDQCIRLRNSCVRWTNPKSPHLSRSVLEYAIGVVQVNSHPDAEIILDLYTMWDVRGDGSVPLLPFFVGLSPLACQRTDDFRTVLRYALQMAHIKEQKQIDGNELFVVLKSLNCTVAYLGDKFLNEKWITEIVADTMSTISLVSTSQDEDVEYPLLLKEDVVAVVAVEPLIKKLLSQSQESLIPPTSPPQPPKCQSADNENQNEETSSEQPQNQTSQSLQQVPTKASLQSSEQPSEELSSLEHLLQPDFDEQNLEQQAPPSQLLLQQRQQKEQRQKTPMGEGGNKTTKQYLHQPRKPKKSCSIPPLSQLVKAATPPPTIPVTTKAFNPSALYWKRESEDDSNPSHSGDRGDDDEDEYDEDDYDSHHNSTSSYEDTVATYVTDGDYTSMNAYLPSGIRCFARITSSSLSRSNSVTSSSIASSKQYREQQHEQQKKTTFVSSKAKTKTRRTTNNSTTKNGTTKKDKAMYCRKSKALFFNHNI